MESEVRTFDFSAEESRALAPRLADDGNTVEGYAIVFNQLSRQLYDRATRKTFTEVIEPRAVSMAFLDTQDIKLNYNHDNTQLLGRSRSGNGTLSYEIDEYGVRYRCELPDTTLGRDVRELIRRGDLFGCSFAFTYDPAGVRDERKDGRNLRTVSSFGSISDFSIVCDPAYYGTMVSTRDFDAPEEEKPAPVEEPAPEPPAPDPKEVNAASIRTLDSIDWEINHNTQFRNMNANILKLKEEAQQLRSLAEERALTSEENMRVERIAEQVRCEKLVDAFDAAPSVNIRQTNEEFAQLVADAVAGNRKIEVRAQNDKASVEPLTPVHIGDIIEPLEKGMILDKLGCKIQTGLTGDWKYPVVQSIDAYIAGENVTISDSALTLAKVTPVPRRVTLGIAVSNMADWASEYEIKDIVLSQLTKAAARALNKWMFSATAIALQGESGTTINGLFSSLASGNSLTATTTGAPTYAEILGLKAAVDSTGVVPDNTAAYVMNNAMAAVLSGTPKASTVVAGFVLENGMINGIPVYITEYAPANTVYFGYFSYGLVGQFGETSITIDPFSGIAENKIKFWFNSAFDIKQARQEAFGKLA